MQDTGVIQPNEFLTNECTTNSGTTFSLGNKVEDILQDVSFNITIRIIIDKQVR